MVLTLVGFLN